MPIDEAAVGVEDHEFRPFDLNPREAPVRSRQHERLEHEGHVLVRHHTRHVRVRLAIRLFKGRAQVNENELLLRFRAGERFIESGRPGQCGGKEEGEHGGRGPV